jgi:multisubunit Na+/H+ antiporter MnhE subunit
MLKLAGFLEMLMLICFGVSWPINIAKAWKARSTKGISVLFYSLILLGYLVGIAAKLALIAAYAPAPWYETVRWYVMFFYVLNTSMVAAGIAIWFRNRRLEKRGD